MDANERLHQEWVGMAQPEGLVVTPATLKEAEANITWPIVETQVALKARVHPDLGVVIDLPGLFRDLLGWEDEYLKSAPDLPESLVVVVEEGDRLAPSFALCSADEPDKVELLVVQVKDRLDLDVASDDKRWTASAHQRFERLLRDTAIPVGLLTNRRDFRLVYAPRGESAGWVTFRLSEMLSVDGRPLLGAFHMLLNERRLLSLAPEKRLGALLKKSREYQNTVSTALREQVLAGLRVLLQGVQAADRLAEGDLLRSYRGEHLHEVYLGLVTVLMRMIFVLYAEERDLLPMTSELYASSYSLTKLYAQLVRDHGEFGVAGLDARYGAWARVLTLFRVLHDGLWTMRGLRLPAREGKLFNPDEFPFLEGRPRGATRQTEELLDHLPRISDGVVFKVLDQLLVLHGERLQYKGLDVEQIGSVYEGLMGFDIEVAEGESVCVTPEHVVINLDAILKLSSVERLKHIKEVANLDLKDKIGAEVKAAPTVDALRAALARRVSSRQPDPIGPGAMYLQPGEERRRSGSHYTPRSLTQPIVETTLGPVLERLSAETEEREGAPSTRGRAPGQSDGPPPGQTRASSHRSYRLTEEQILSLKVCDPAMGSGAFLVEACRQLSEHLVAAWRRTGAMPELPLDEDPLLHARRLVAQRCLYGVDKNPLAVDLARLSMWLVTFAKEHPFTFVDHAFRSGDSLVGLSKAQIIDLTPFPIETKGEAGAKPAKGKKASKPASTQLDLMRPLVVKAVAEADGLRKQIHAIGDPPDNAELRRLWKDTNDALDRARLLGDLVVAAYFGADSDKSRTTALENLRVKVQHWLSTGELEGELRGMAAGLREGGRPLEPFHWEIEFPEVFGRGNSGFDCFVGNPPFLGGTLIGGRLGLSYHVFLADCYSGSSGLVDLAAFFFRRSFDCLAHGGTLGLLSTNTISQGDTRSAGLGQLLRQGGTIFCATKRYVWPGDAAVVVSVVHIARGASAATKRLDGNAVKRISAFLVASTVDDDPPPLPQNRGVAFGGTKVWGAGFLFEDEPKDGSSSIEAMQQILVNEPHSKEVIFPYLGGEEFNLNPSQSPCRFVIDFGEAEENAARRWISLFRIVEERVRPVRLTNKQRNYRENWWLHANRVLDAIDYMRGHSRLLGLAQTSKHLSVGFVQRGTIASSKMILVLLDSFAGFSVIQSSLHRSWAAFLGSSMKDDPVYTVNRCFDTFPFPPSLYPLSSPPPSPTLNVLEAIGKEYYEFRATLMADDAVRKTLMAGLTPEGLTKTYNRFHDPDCHLPGIVKLRELHAQMDRAVLDAYGWTDIQPEYDFREQLDEHVRLTWAEETRDEVLARLLELNRVMAEAEAAEAHKTEASKQAADVAKKAEKKQTAKSEAAKKSRGGQKKNESTSLALPGTGENES